MKHFAKNNNYWTEMDKFSNEYYVGIEVSPRYLKVKECNIGENITVTLRPTIPIESSTNVPGADRIVVSVLIPQEYKARRRQAAVDKCRVELTTKDITYGKTITIRGICDNQNDKRQNYFFHFKPQATGTSWLGLDNYRMSAIKVVVDNTDTRLCFTSTDPNLFTFDNRYLFYNELGNYVMYNNEAKNIQVHVRLWICAGEMTCVCGAAIREGKDVIVMSMCNKMNTSVPTMLRTFKRSPGRLSKGIQILKKINGATLEHEVILSSGTRISVMRSGKSLDVRINAPATEKGRVSGLCGNLNYNPNDDLNQGGDGRAHQSEETFTKSWRIPDKKSFFGVSPDQEVEPQEVEPLDAEPQEVEPEQERFCYCGIEGEDEHNEQCVDNANLFKRFDATKLEVIQLNDQSSQFAMKRSADHRWYSDDIIDHVDRSYLVDDPHVQHVINRIRNKRSPRVVISRDEATKYCRKEIEQSKAGRMCKAMSATNINNSLLQSVNDLTLTGDKSFAVLAFETMKYICEDNTLKNLSLYTQTASGDLMPPRDMVQDLCTSDSSGHGKCKNQTCICDEGFTALDCSMDVQAVPELLGIYNGGLCDVRERPCKKTNLLGQKFIDSKNLTCHVQEVKLYPGSWSPRRISITSQGKMTDLFGVKCSLPEPPTKLNDYVQEGTPAGGLLISVSNDGSAASAQRLRHVTYDSKCMRCSKSGNCERRANSCLIRGHCFAANEPNPSNWCEQCLPRDDQDSWTPRKHNQAPKFTLKPTYNALRGEDLVMQLKAIDPENRPVRYSVQSSTTTDYRLRASGLMTWKVTSNQKFTFKVIDECGAFDTTVIRVRIVHCPCLNGGRCVPHPYHPRGSGLYQCQCVNGITGDHCEKNNAKALEKVPNAVPLIRHVIAVNYGIIRVTWSRIPRNRRNGFIRGYKIYYRQLHTKDGIWNVSTTFITTGDLTSAMVTGLNPYTEYCLKISAFTRKGESPNWKKESCYIVKRS